MTHRPEQCFPSQAQHNRAALLLGVSLLTSWGSVCLCSHPCTMYFVLPGTIHWANVLVCCIPHPGLAAWCNTVPSSFSPDHMEL